MAMLELNAWIPQAILVAVINVIHINYSEYE